MAFWTNYQPTNYVCFIGHSGMVSWNTFPMARITTKYPSTWVKLVLPLILLKRIAFAKGTSHRTSHLTVSASQLMQYQNLTKKTKILPCLNASGNTRALLGPLVGWRIVHIPISRLPTLFLRHIPTNPCLAIGMPCSKCSIIFIQWLIMAYHSPPKKQLCSMRSCTFPPPLTRKPIMMPFPLKTASTILSLHLQQFMLGISTWKWCAQGDPTSTFLILKYEWCHCYAFGWTIILEGWPSRMDFPHLLPGRNQSNKHGLSPHSKHKKHDLFPFVPRLTHHQRRFPYSTLQR